MLELFWYSFFIGFFLAIPVGPVAFLCIHRSLHRGIRLGLITGAGAAFADGVFGAIAGISLTFISEFLTSHKIIITVGGGIFLIALGLKTLYTPAKQDMVDVISKKQFIYAFGTGFFLTLINPVTLLAFTAVLASLGVMIMSNTAIKIGMLIWGFTAGSFAWWFLLCNLATFIFGDILNTKTLPTLNKTAGVIFIALGFISLLSLTNLYSYVLNSINIL